MSNLVVHFWELGNGWGDGRVQSTLRFSNRGHGRRSRHYRQRRNGRRRLTAAIVVVARRGRSHQAAVEPQQSWS